jgi:hypothetical protein
VPDVQRAGASVAAVKWGDARASFASAASTRARRAAVAARSAASCVLSFCIFGRERGDLRLLLLNGLDQRRGQFAIAHAIGAGGIVLARLGPLPNRTVKPAIASANFERRIMLPFLAACGGGAARPPKTDNLHGRRRAFRRPRIRNSQQSIDSRRMPDG